jgi:hypothetical protein
MPGRCQGKLAGSGADLQDGLVSTQIQEIKDLGDLSLDVSMSLHILIVELGQGIKVGSGMVGLMVLPGRHSHLRISISFVKAAKAFSPLLLSWMGQSFFRMVVVKNLLRIAYKILLCMTFSQGLSTKLICLSDEDSMPLLWALRAESSSSSYHLGLLPL